MFHRTLLTKIEKFLPTHDILLLYGARQVGKTTLMKIIQTEYLKKPSYFFDLETSETFKILNDNPDRFIEYLKSYHKRDGKEDIVIFIDEIQYLDNPTSFLKYLYDKYAMIKFIISGSSTLEIRGKLKDSLVGRMLKFEVSPLSFEEFLLFKDKKNLVDLVGKPQSLDIINNEMKFFYEEYAKFWGYPKVVLSNDEEMKRVYLEQIFDTYIQKDIKDIGNIRAVEKFNRLVKILANQAGNLVNFSELSNTLDISINTLNEWMFLLENTFVIKLITPFSTNIRSELTKKPKLFFIDQGLRNSCDASFEITGNSFENSFFATIHHRNTGKHLNFYRTQDKKEIDFILDGIPYELKLAYNGKNLTALDYFTEKYGKKGNVVTLTKKEHTTYQIFYPWEI